jgi:hypothetical protein
MRHLAQQSAVCVIAFSCLLAVCKPEPTAAPIAPVLITEAATPKPNDDGAGDLSQPSDIATETPDVAQVSAPNLPPMQVGLDASDSSARGLSLVETHATPSAVPGVSDAGPAASVAAYTDRPTFTRYVSCASGNCAVNAAPIRRRLFGRFRR